MNERILDVFEDIVQRALNTFCQSLLASIGISALTGVAGIAWWPVVSIALLETLISVLQNIIKHTGDGIDYKGSDDA